MALPAAALLAKGATQLLASEAATKLAKKFGDAVYDRVFTDKSAPPQVESNMDLALVLAEIPTRQELERAFEALEARLLMVAEMKATAGRKTLYRIGGGLAILQLAVLAALLSR